MAAAAAQMMRGGSLVRRVGSLRNQVMHLQEYYSGSHLLGHLYTSTVTYEEWKLEMPNFLNNCVHAKMSYLYFNLIL